MRLTGVVLSCAVVAACCLGLTQPALAQQKLTKTVTTSPLSIDLTSLPLAQSRLVSAARRTVQTLPMTITLSTPSSGAPNTLSAATSGAAGPKRSAITTAQLTLNLGPSSVIIPGAVINAPKRSVATSPLVINLGSTPGSAAAGKLARTITASPLVINLATIAAAPPSSSKRAITTGTLAITLTR